MNLFQTVHIIFNCYIYIVLSDFNHRYMYNIYSIQSNFLRQISITDTCTTYTLYNLIFSDRWKFQEMSDPAGSE